MDKGQKFNENKLPMDTIICKQFPNALRAIARCTEYGHQKYIETDEDYQNFRKVKGGSQTYADALLRHSMQEGDDLESGLPHKWHKAWNALAELELYLEEQESKSPYGLTEMLLQDKMPGINRKIKVRLDREEKKQDPRPYHPDNLIN